MLATELFIGLAPFVTLLPFVLLIEAVSAKDRYSWRSRFPGMFFFFLSPTFGILLSWPLHLAWNRLGIPPVVSLRGLHPLAIFVVLFVFLDFVRYWEHRFEHRFMWRFHAIHHSPTDLHAAHVFGHPFQGLSELFFLSIPFSLIDTGGAGWTLVLGLAVSLQNFLIHSPLRVHAGRGRAVWVDSRYHRIHHSVEKRHWHKNFGLCFTFWDQLFGTHQATTGETWPDTGVPGFPPPKTLSAFLFQPFRRLTLQSPARQMPSSQTLG